MTLQHGAIVTNILPVVKNSAAILPITLCSVGFFFSYMTDNFFSLTYCIIMLDPKTHVNNFIIALFLYGVSTPKHKWHKCNRYCSTLFCFGAVCFQSVTWFGHAGTIGEFESVKMKRWNCGSFVKRCSVSWSAALIRQAGARCSALLRLVCHCVWAAKFTFMM